MNANSMREISYTDWERFDAMADEEIDTSDIPLLDEEFFAHATLRLPKPRSTVMLNIDSDILEWFQSQGTEFQERINIGGCDKVWHKFCKE
jgi:uncharacterized protein (DUF4415 family)